MFNGDLVPSRPDLTEIVLKGSWIGDDFNYSWLIQTDVLCVSSMDACLELNMPMLYQ